MVKFLAGIFDWKVKVRGKQMCAWFQMRHICRSDMVDKWVSECLWKKVHSSCASGRAKTAILIGWSGTEWMWSVYTAEWQTDSNSENLSLTPHTSSGYFHLGKSTLCTGLTVLILNCRLFISKTFFNFRLISSFQLFSTDSCQMNRPQGRRKGWGHARKKYCDF